MPFGEDGWWKAEQDPLRNREEAGERFRRFWPRRHARRSSPLAAKYQFVSRARDDEGTWSWLVRRKVDGTFAEVEFVGTGIGGAVRAEDFARFRRDFDARAVLRHPSLLALVDQGAARG